MNGAQVSQGPTQPPVDRERAEATALAALYQAVWEASQFCSTEHIQDYVLITLREIEVDEP